MGDRGSRNGKRRQQLIGSKLSGIFGLFEQSAISIFPPSFLLLTVCVWKLAPVTKIKMKKGRR